MRSYGEYCAVAQALDVVGERWTLLIVRELLIRGPCRYTDLQNGLPGIATNLLAERLREMETAGILRRHAALPPVAAMLFQLTPRGEELKPVVEALARWGTCHAARPCGEDAFLSHWLKLPIELQLRDRTPGEPPIAIELRTGDEPMLLETVDGSIRARPGHAERPDALITGGATQVLDLLTGRMTLAQARRRNLKFEGSEEALLRVQP